MFNNTIDPLVFYKIMKYPVPKNKEQFFWFEEISNLAENNIDNYSWDEKNLLIDDFMLVINKYWFLYRSFPFVSNIYLCNSISFNAIDEDSDIDFFLVTKQNRIWTSRFFSVLMCQLFWLRWWKQKKPKKIDLGFYVSEDVLNMYNLCLKPYDLYIVYWLVHLVPLYSENINNKDVIFQENKWLKNYLPNLSIKSNIHLWNQFFEWSNLFKKIVEKILWWFLWDFFEFLIKSIWLPIVIYKTKKQWKNAWGIIVSDKILKFHWADIRKLVNLKYSIFNKK